MEKKIYEKILKLQNVAEIFKEIKTYKNTQNWKNDLYTELSFKIKHYENIMSDKAFLKIGVVGNFSSGKSLFINSLLGINLLGVNVNPSTSKITKITKGKSSDCKYFVVEEKSTEENVEVSKEISEDEFNKFSYRKNGEKIQNSSYEKNIKHFEVHIDNHILNYVEIYDTPGFSSDSVQDDLITKKSIKEFDVIFWLIDCNKGSIGNDELKILKELQIENVYAVINKVDSKPPSERKKIIEEIGKQYSFRNILPYSALGLIEYSKKINEVDNLGKEINNIIFNKNNVTLKLSLNNGKIIIEQENVENSEYFIPELEDDYKHYFDILYDEIMLIRQNSKSSQLNRLFFDLSDIENKQKNEINDIIINDREYIIKLEKELEYKKSIYDKAIENLEKAVNERYNSISSDMFERVFGILYNYTGNNKYQLVKEFPNDKLVNCISEGINKIAKLYINYLNEFIENIKDEDEEVDDLSNVLDDLCSHFTDASVRGLVAIHWLLNFTYPNFENNTKDKSNILSCIDDVIAEEQIYYISYNIILPEIENIFNIYSRKYSDLIKDTQRTINLFEEALTNLNILSEQYSENNFIIWFLDFLQQKKLT